MTRRPLAHPVERLAKAQSRMAPGGLLWSESPIPKRFTPRVPMAGDDTPAGPVTLAVTTGSSRFDPGFPIIPTTVDVLGNLSVYVPGTGWTDVPITGDPVAAVVVTEGATVTAPAGWTTLASGSLGSSVVWRLAVVSQAPAGLSGVWAVPGSGDWVYCAWAPTRLPDSTSPLGRAYTWDVQLDTPTTSETTGTWPVPTDPTWLYSMPSMVCEVHQYLAAGTGNTNSVGTPYELIMQSGGSQTNKTAYTHVATAMPVPVNYEEKAEYFPHTAGDSLGRVWHPDNSFPWYSVWKPGNVKQLFLLGLK